MITTKCKAYCLRVLLLTLTMTIVSFSCAFGEEFLEYVSGTTGNVAVEGPYKLFDNDVTSKWCIEFTGQSHVIFKTPEPVRIKGYILTKANDDRDSIGRSPQKWSLYGVNAYTAPLKTDPSWILIDSYDGDLMDINENYAGFAFLLSQEQPAYEYYMLIVDRTLGDQYLQLSEIQLITNNTLQARLACVDNTRDTIIALGELQYDESLLKMLPTVDILSEKVVFGGGLTPIKNGDTREIRFELKDVNNTEYRSSVKIKMTEEYNVEEEQVDGIEYSSVYIFVK